MPRSLERREMIRRLPGPDEDGGIEGGFPPGRIDRPEIAALPQAGQPLLVAQGHRLPEAGELQGVERLDQCLGRGPRDELRVAKLVLAIAKEVKEGEGCPDPSG